MLFTRDQPTRESSRFNRDKLPDGSGIRLMTREQRACYAVGGGLSGIAFAIKRFHWMRKESPMLTILIRWLIFLHVLAALTFFLAHGTSAAMAFKIRKETDFTRIGAILDLSWSTG